MSQYVCACVRVRARVCVCARVGVYMGLMYWGYAVETCVLLPFK